MLTCTFYTFGSSPDPCSYKGLGSHPRINMCWDLTKAGFTFLPATRQMCINLIAVGKTSQAYPLSRSAVPTHYSQDPCSLSAEYLSPGSGVGEGLLGHCRAKVGMAATVSPMHAITLHQGPLWRAGEQWWHGGGNKGEAG